MLSLPELSIENSVFRMLNVNQVMSLDFLGAEVVKLTNTTIANSQFFSIDKPAFSLANVTTLHMHNVTLHNITTANMDVEVLFSRALYPDATREVSIVNSTFSNVQGKMIGSFGNYNGVSVRNTTFTDNLSGESGLWLG